jgi:hypothetical protein
VAFQAIMTAPMVLMRPLGAGPNRRALGVYSAATGVAGLALLVAYVAAPHGWNGLGQRAFLTVLVAWIAVLGYATIWRQPAARTGTAR